jgi:hypothetical protein
MARLSSMLQELEGIRKHAPILPTYVCDDSKRPVGSV